MKIYTKTGDGGDTGLYGGERRPKDDPRIVAYGDVDELQAVLGLARAYANKRPDISDVLYAIQQDCFVICAELARTETKKARKDPVLGLERVVWLEESIDAFDATLPVLTAFIVQGGALLGAHLHVARTVGRRAERSVIGLAHTENVSQVVRTYLNRLSDLLFVLARTANHQDGSPEEELHAS
ncbi:MAG TPA: cob(I)yrinic acid a,c-diamide adenosyltransferase [Verrucomicrobiae bacterium]|nr:cob(I)yrinic acid a,c-diamide adenosyltransferase [Verrucomicrobiae bacterium]